MWITEYYIEKKYTGTSTFDNQRIHNVFIGAYMTIVCWSYDIDIYVMIELQYTGKTYSFASQKICSLCSGACMLSTIFHEALMGFTWFMPHMIEFLLNDGPRHWTLLRCCNLSLILLHSSLLGFYSFYQCRW